MATYMVRRIGSSDPKFGMNSRKFMWEAPLLKDNAFIAILRSVPREEQEPVPCQLI
jgi:hypothetical protein